MRKTRDKSSTSPTASRSSSEGQFAAWRRVVPSSVFFPLGFSALVVFVLEFGVWSLEFSVFVFSLVCKHAYPIKQEKTIEQMFE
jgi:hypothetical protein